METQGEAVDLIDADVVLSLAQAVVIAALLGIGAYVTIPLPLSPVPMTLQVLVVFLAGVFLGPYWGGGAVVLYLTAGALGAPIFSGGSAGLGSLVGQNAGYLWGFLLAAILIGLLVHGRDERIDPSDRSLAVVAVALVSGLILIYALGVAWLSWVLELALVDAVVAGALPFIPGDVISLVAVLALVKSEEIVIDRRG